MPMCFSALRWPWERPLRRDVQIALIVRRSAQCNALDRIAKQVDWEVCAAKDALQRCGQRLACWALVSNSGV